MEAQIEGRRYTITNLDEMINLLKGRGLFKVTNDREGRLVIVQGSLPLRG